MQNPICFMQPYHLFGASHSILTVICAIKEPRVMRHMNTEIALLTVAVEQRLAQHSVLLFYVAVEDGGV